MFEGAVCESIEFVQHRQGCWQAPELVSPIPAANFPVQALRTADSIQFPHYPFQPLPTPNGPAPYRFDLSSGA
jgi:hypothetical protein